jgi:hypothetical protein
VIITVENSYFLDSCLKLNTQLVMWLDDLRLNMIPTQTTSHGFYELCIYSVMDGSKDDILQHFTSQQIQDAAQMVHMTMVNNESYRSYRTVGCFYNLLTFYLQKQSCIVKSFSALLQQQFMNYGSWMLKKVKSSCLASGKKSSLTTKFTHFMVQGHPWAFKIFSAD